MFFSVKTKFSCCFFDLKWAITISLDSTGFDWIQIQWIQSNPVESSRIQWKLKTQKFSNIRPSSVYKIGYIFVIWFQNYTPIFGHWSRPEVLSQFFQIWIIAIIRDRARYARFKNPGLDLGAYYRSRTGSWGVESVDRSRTDTEWEAWPCTGQLRE